MDKSIFDFSDYRSYLEAKTGAPGTRKGVKAAMAKALHCQPTYISQVLHEKAHLSLEQAEILNGFFSHSKEEAFYFLLLVQKDRAGTKALREFFQEQIDEALRRRLVLTKRLGPKDVLSEVDQATYYSSWIYAALHIALTIPELRTREALSDYFHLPIRKITEALDFLISAGLVASTGNGYAVTKAQIRLGNDSKNILKHHTNWRLQSAESLDREQLTDMHYSGVVSLSKADVIKVKNILLDAVKTSQALIKDSKEEELCAIAIDFFNLRK
ncbi:TIGR02147 family protein [Bdellovibrio sp. KM01]|uniref:TIGR02147 family protein n=1 Tax=Bdellovibrio sp. KM01 TaxID=2748865 RepID=UPI0015EAB76F|nr:TIGR02147 family protein [Bdellovibrio sp. KM01]QLY25771.1 TIGR02147 family protein [Bdellovibrio sp. KM01]